MTAKNVASEQNAQMPVSAGFGTPVFLPYEFSRFRTFYCKLKLTVNLISFSNQKAYGGGPLLLQAFPSCLGRGPCGPWWHLLDVCAMPWTTTRPRRPGMTERPAAPVIKGPPASFTDIVVLCVVWDL
jgi:hypothetical protein